MEPASWTRNPALFWGTLAKLEKMVWIMRLRIGWEPRSSWAYCGHGDSRVLERYLLRCFAALERKKTMAKPEFAAAPI
jgi:hypothetical protein